jgi:hypothetical protein
VCLDINAKTDRQNTFAPEGASRCRALASGLKGRAAGRKERLFEDCAGLNADRAAKSRKVQRAGADSIDQAIGAIDLFIRLKLSSARSV